MAQRGGADEYARSKQYSYDAVSSLVLTAERSGRNAAEPTGRPESLWGKLQGKMGDRAFGTKNAELEQRKSKGKKRNPPPGDTTGGALDDLLLPATSKRARRSQPVSLRSYRPRTKETREAYELLLSLLTSSLGDQPAEILHSAAEEVLEVLKNESLTDPQRHGQLESLLGPIPSERFAHMVAVGKVMSDFVPESERAKGRGDEDEANEMDEMGVAVEFEEEEDEDEEDGDEVVDVEEELGEEDEDGEAREGEGGGGGGDDTKRGPGVKATRTKATTRDNLPHDGLALQDIDAYWLQRQVSRAFGPDALDAAATQQLAEETLLALSSATDDRDAENRLVSLLDFERFELIKLLLTNRLEIVHCTKLARASSVSEREEMERAMRASGGRLKDMVDRLHATRASVRDRQTAIERNIRSEAEKLRGGNDARHEGAEEEEDEDLGGTTTATTHNNNTTTTTTTSARGPMAPIVAARHAVDLDSLSFSAGGHLMSNKTCSLPPGSYRTAHKGYEEVYVPPLQAQPLGDDEHLVQISSLPAWAQAAFDGMTSLNRIQSKVSHAALYTNENLLMCAPTGAGKTNVAMLSIMHELGMHRREDGSIDTKKFKIVYIAPMKALVAEMVGNFSKRLAPYNIVVRELTGDVSMSRAELDATQIIVTTPEKWDIITRKSGDKTYINLVKLIIIDEIHLLHDDRGHVLESIVARTVRQIESSQEMIRLVGLSATLPNYQDVAAFLRVKPDKGLFYFDGSFRPCPLEQTYVGLVVKKPLQRFQLMNEICYDKVVERAGKHQMLIFVHSRKETAKTAKFIRDAAMSKDTLARFLPADASSREILSAEANNCKSQDLKDLLPHGFAIHHAGMSRADRTLVEDLFGDGHVQVLVSTATLAWGVNLPAHTVLIKGTQVYNPVKSAWDELSMLDMMQMLGRAGRPQFDSFGEGIILTGHTELQYYLSLLNQQLPVESQYVAHLADNMNAECVLGTLSSVQDAARWLGYTYLYVRMLRAPGLYAVPLDTVESDPLLLERRLDLVHTAAVTLEKQGLLKYDLRTGQLASTELGRIASHYYITHHTLATFHQHLKPSMGEIDLLRLFSLSDEFKFLIVREEEKLELTKLMDRVPIPVKESVDDPRAKINVLLQAYISRLKLDGLALQADMVYITQSAGRLMRCLFEICLRRGWVGLADKALTLCKSVMHRIWITQSPLRQFRGVPSDVLTKMERKDISWERYYDLSATELGELVRVPKLGKALHKVIHMFPRVELAAHILPLTRTLLKVDLTITPDFEWDDKTHGAVEAFWIWIEDADSEVILHRELLVLKQQFANEDHFVTCTVPLMDPLPPQYFVRVVSDKWLGCEAVLPISFRHLLLPERFAPPTELLDLQPLPLSALRNREYEALYNESFESFNAIQTQCFTALYQGDEHVLLAAPVGAGKTLCAELAILRMVSRALEGKCTARAVYLAPHAATVDKMARHWRRLFGDGLGLRVEVLKGGDAVGDTKLLEQCNIALATPSTWDAVSRRWKTRKAVQQVALVIADNLHLLGGDEGHVLEICLSRVRYMATQLSEAASGGSKCRIVALSASIANARDVAAWLGAPHHATFSFHPSVRPVPLLMEVRGMEVANYEARMQAMVKPTYHAIKTHAAITKKKKNKEEEGGVSFAPTIVFVPTRKHARQMTLDLLTHAAGDGNASQFLNCAPEEMASHAASLSDPALRQGVQYGIGYVYDTQPQLERDLVEKLFVRGDITVLVATQGTVWGMSASAKLVVLAGTSKYEGGDYSLADVLEMAGRANRPRIDTQAACLLLCHAPRKDYYKRFLLEPFPIESHLNHALHNHLNAEIVTETIEGKQEAVDYLTWTFYYRRLPLNPNYYNLTGNSHRHISDHLSELIELTMDDLAKSGCIIIDENELDVKPANMGRIAAHYYVNYTTIEIFKASLSSKTKLRGLLEILAASSEFDSLPVRPGEEEALRRLVSHLPLPIESTKFHDPHVKANALLQAHLSRLHVAGDLAQDQAQLLLTCTRLLYAMVDVIASEGWVSPLLAAMELAQCVVQGCWTNDPPLLQLPHVSKQLAAEAKERFGVVSVYDLLDLDDADRDKLLSPLSEAQLADVARACNRFPDVAVQASLATRRVTPGAQVALRVGLQRDWDVEEQGAVPPVDAPRYPGSNKMEGWWVVGVDPAVGSVLYMKKVTLDVRAESKGAFLAPMTLGRHTIKVYCMNDAYVGCDQEHALEYEVVAGDEAEA